jgi:hypothetical protein
MNYLFYMRPYVLHGGKTPIETHARSIDKVLGPQ